MTVSNKNGILFILSSPSGAGKSTICKSIINHDSKMELSISYTTRPIRSKERKDIDYHFIANKHFIELRDNMELLEYAHIFGNYYGTSKIAVNNALNKGNDVLFDIDWQGANQLRSHKNYRIVSIFILPPSISELSRRLKHRAEDDVKTQAKRLQGAKVEILHYDEYDYIVINNDIQQSISKVLSIINSERLRLYYKESLKTTVEDILNN